MNLKDVITQNSQQSAFHLMAHMMVWFGDGHVHRVNRYVSTDKNLISRQLDLYKSAGFDGVIVTWQGPQAKFTHQATMEVCNRCIQKDMLFVLLLDPAVASNGPTREASVSAAMSDAGFQEMILSPAYIPENYVLDFSTGADYTKVIIPSGINILMNQSGFGWPNAYNGDNTRTLNELKGTHAKTTMKIPCVCFQFNDAGFPIPAGVSSSSFTGTRDYGSSVWTSGKAPRAIDHQAGNFFLDTIGTLATQPYPYIALVTANDHDEGTGVEQWIAACNGVRL